MKNTKKLLASALCVALCATMFAGCGDSGKGGDNSAAANGGDGKSGSLTINYLSSRNTDEAVMTTLQDIADNYAKENPDMDFSYEVESITDRTSYLQKLKILASSNELPEWFESDPDTFFVDLVNNDTVYNIEDLYNELGVGDKFFNICKEYVKLPGTDKIYLMSWQANAEYFFYNKDLFEQAGIAETPKTMDELMDVCKTLKDAGITPISTTSSDWPVLRYFAMIPFRQTGNSYLEEACAGTASWGTDVGIENAAYMQELAQYFQTGFSSTDYDTMVDLFVGNKAAMLYNGTWVLADLLDESTGDLRSDLGYFTMLTYKDNDTTGASDYFANCGIGTAVRKDVMTQEMKDYLAYVFENYSDIALNDYNLLPSIKPSSTDGLPEIYQTILNDVTNVNTYAKCWDVVIDSASLETLNKSTTELCLGEMTPQEWADSLDKAVEANKK
ncbi:ABC transporter substrate-binding protein [Massiliimalia massiliensis]|uniref:ABC transporter substrate-binding protein n=1 Tax=Massiliimalia massiliensis TaxID=1852384 RepID=UPI0009871AAC|nr:extracellular solute-binding protein [Massiliimalia massiliensis]